jgi:hypothetical protein
VRQFLTCLRKLIGHILLSLCNEVGYSALFKAGIVLLGLSLLSISQVGPFLYEKDLAAHKAKFTLETTFNQALDAMDCRQTGALQTECLLAQHEMTLFNTANGLLVEVITTSLGIGQALLGLSAFGFLCKPLVNCSASSQSQNTKP